MPIRQLESLIKKSPRKLTIKDAEHIWEESKKAADNAVKTGKLKENSSQYWSYVMAITMKRMKIKTDKESKVNHVSAYFYDHCFNIVHANIDAKPMYVKRDVLNGQVIIDWAKSQGFERALDVNDFHVTISYSRKPVFWNKIILNTKNLTIKGGKRTVEPLGDEGAIVLKFQSEKLSNRWAEIIEAGASWDYDGYHPHVTITYQGSEVDLNTVTPYSGPIELGPEIVEDLNTDYSDDIEEKPIND